MVAGSFGIFAGILLAVMALGRRVVRGAPPATITYNHPFEKYSPLYLDELEAEARALPQRSEVLGEPVIDDKLIAVMFEGKKAGGLGERLHSLPHLLCLHHVNNNNNNNNN
jgi:hypothetical protein